MHAALMHKALTDTVFIDTLVIQPIAGSATLGCTTVLKIECNMRNFVWEEIISYIHTKCVVAINILCVKQRSTFKRC